MSLYGKIYIELVYAEMFRILVESKKTFPTQILVVKALRDIGDCKSFREIIYNHL